MAKVFFLNWAGHDLNPAKKFSNEIVLITKGDQDLFELDRLRYRINEVIKENDFDYENDFVVLSGSSIMTYLIGTIFGENFSKINILLWDAKAQQYKLQTHSSKTVHI